MKRKLLIALLALGTVGGFAGGFASMCRHKRWREARLEARVTDICAAALRQAQSQSK